MISMTKNNKPIVYSCSGCSNLAQMANQVAVKLNESQKAEMSCIVGVGGNVPSLVKIAQSGRPILAIDGCHLACSKQCLANHDVTPDKHLILSDIGYKKRYNQLMTDKDIDEALSLTMVLCDEL